MRKLFSDHHVWKLFFSCYYKHARMWRRYSMHWKAKKANFVCDFCIPSTLNTDLIFWQLQLNFGSSKILNHGLNVKLFISPYIFFFSQMTDVLCIFFQVFIVLGMYNFALFVIFAWVRDRFDGATNYHNFTAWIT